jgi:hypothetical protein
VIRVQQWEEGSRRSNGKDHFEGGVEVGDLEAWREGDYLNGNEKAY